VKLIDFGIALASEGARLNLTAQGAALGTRRYMSPEQIEGEHSDIDASTDQFSLAVISYLLFTGRLPFDGADEAEIRHRIQNEPPPPLPPNLHNIEQVLLRGLAKSRKQRYASVREFHAALEDSHSSYRSYVVDVEPTVEVEGQEANQAEEHKDVAPSPPTPAPPEPTATLPPPKRTTGKPASDEHARGQPRPAPPKPRSIRLLALLGALALVGLVVVLVIRVTKSPTPAPESKSIPEPLPIFEPPAAEPPAPLPPPPTTQPAELTPKPNPLRANAKRPRPSTPAADKDGRASEPPKPKPAPPPPAAAPRPEPFRRNNP
jgi:serine/threonine protein kinase